MLRSFDKINQKKITITQLIIEKVIWANKNGDQLDLGVLKVLIKYLMKSRFWVSQYSQTI